MPYYGSLDFGFGTTKGEFLDKNGVITQLRNDRRGNYFHSYAAKTDGKTLIDHAARNLALTQPEMVAHGFKEYLGDDVKRYFKNTATATEVLAMMLVVILVHFEQQSGSKFDGFIMTCPANFTDMQRRGFLKACEIAGIVVIQLITEPAAAAFAYAVRDAAGAGRESLVACADLGHGTFDCSLLHVKHGDAVPISTEGVPLLGGRNFTDILEKILLEKVGKAIGKPVLKEKLSPAQAAHLREAAEAGKIDLSTQPNTVVPLNFGGQSQAIEVTQKEYEAACEPLIKQMLACIDLTMKKAGKTFKDLESFVLAGAPFNSDRLRERVADHTGIAVRGDHDPANVVSHGAMLHAMNLARKAGGQVSLPEMPILREATAHDVGIAVVDEGSPNRLKKCAIIVKKNTPIPCKHTEPFRPERANQASVAVDVLHGAEGTPASQCERIASFVVPGLRPNAQRIPCLEVTFDIDKNGLLKVTAKDGDDGPEDSVTVQLKK